MAGFDKVTGSSAGVNRDKNDYYPTPPVVTRCLLDREEFHGPILEPCAGAGHIVRELEARGYPVISNEPYPQGGFETDERMDFLTAQLETWRGCRSVVTNPPYRLAQKFIERAIEMGFDKHAWLLRFQFVESACRYPLFLAHPPRRLWIFSKRVQVSERGLLDPKGGMIVYAWWVWERGFAGHPELCWVEPAAIRKE